MISIEESTKTEAIISMYERLAQRHENVGMTIQAHLHRSLDDVKRVLELPGKIRLVKGACKEPQEIALARSDRLAEHPPHVHQAIADMFDPARLQDVGYGIGKRSI
ncbi:hypothetical protein P4V43_07365 [Brevibacillus fortis]|uniref:hypothetical protein n=1 Tax=Brevibacillus fortis TaxID=2126352 RepID=UPI002E226674|nr:hypothetical protein [Brevibacillus fortis]